MTAGLATIPAPAGTSAESTEDGFLLAAARRAGQRVAPSWPLRHIVAVNPYLGLADRPFAEADAVMRQVAGAKLTMARGFYAEAIATGRITEADLEAALAATPYRSGPLADVAALKAFAAAPETRSDTAAAPTMADLAAARSGTDWPRLVAERISFWAAGYFDEGIAGSAAPWRDLPAFAAWRHFARIDRTPEIAGLAGFRRHVATLPETAPEAIEQMLARLALPAGAVEPYCHRLLMTIGGWAAYARYLAWTRDDEAPLEALLAVRLAWEIALLDRFDLSVAEIGRAFATAEAEAESVERSACLALHAAYEHRWQRDLIARLGTAPEMSDTTRPEVQAVFCIDVRSERFRRALEQAMPSAETLGFAGFFGVSVEYVRFGAEGGTAHCPALIRPAVTVQEIPLHADRHERDRMLAARLLKRRVTGALATFRKAALASFSYVEAAGLAYAGRLIADSLALARQDGHRHEAAEIFGPDLTAGLDRETKLGLARGILTAMRPAGVFARLVLLAGHGATSVNNPHATALDCGACGGHTGEANARIAATILNDPQIRATLRAEGFDLPDDTVFVAGLHDTTTDAVMIFDRATIPPGHADDVARLELALEEAGRITRRERAGFFEMPAGIGTDDAVSRRGRDWSQPRPEWGLAGCAAFIAAPRHRTAGLDLGGRSFLHSYDWRTDKDFRVLELIMTAPMVVASWISLQYHGSVVAPDVFGAGNKVLHNIAGAIGVLEGNGGDLRIGLPWQSVHDGTRFVHEPMRLSVLIEAPTEAINRVIAAHDTVRQLLANGWLHLFAIGPDGAVSVRYAGGLRWIDDAAAPDIEEGAGMVPA